MGTPITEIKAVWSGFPGAPGYTQLYFLTGDTPTEDAQLDADAVHTFFQSNAANLPAGLHIDVQGDFRVLDDATGALLSMDSIATGEPQVSGSGAGTFAGPAGACVDWQTAGINRGRRIRGRTFLVPLVTACYQNDGTLDPGSRGAIKASADALIAARPGAFAVWSRPRAGAGGKAVAVSGSIVPDLAAVLRSRRD